MVKRMKLLMNEIFLIIKKEWRFFLGSDKGIFFLYLFLVFSWSLMLVAPHSTTLTKGPLWLVFFSVIISANFANNVFIAERVHGILEILITSGISRRQILLGKMLFVAITGFCIGIICIGAAYIWKLTVYSDSMFSLSLLDLITYLCAVFFNTAAGAYLSLKMSNPRLMHLATIFILACLVILYSIIQVNIPLPDETLPALLIISGTLFTTLSIRLYESEKILKPISL